MLTENERMFWIRRIHSLLGVFPLGVFLIQHLAANSLSVMGQSAFNDWVAMLQGMPMVWVLEWGLIFLPILAHGIIGFVYLWSSKTNVGQFNYGRNWLYTMQRYTGIIVFAFILYHVITLTFMSHEWKHDFYALLSAMFQSTGMVIVYLIGATCTIFHFSNGLATFCITWGITVTERSQKMMLIACIFIGFALFGMTLVGIAGFRYGPAPVH